MAKLTAASVNDWIANVKQGTVLPYHDGLLMLDRLRDERLDAAASALLAASDRGEVRLLQKRIEKPSPTGMRQELRAEPACQYFAVRLRGEK